jgi:hypothetical protein
MVFSDTVDEVARMKTSWIAACALACATLAASAASFGAIALPAPMPEPATYGMMLAGLGALTLLGRRRTAPARQD